MMGRRTVDQSQLFYLFNLERRQSFVLDQSGRQILGELRQKLAPFYSDIGRPSIDLELQIVECQEPRAPEPNIPPRSLPDQTPSGGPGGMLV